MTPTKSWPDFRKKWSPGSLESPQIGVKHNMFLPARTYHEMLIPKMYTFKFLQKVGKEKVFRAWFSSPTNHHGSTGKGFLFLVRLVKTSCFFRRLFFDGTGFHHLAVLRSKKSMGWTSQKQGGPRLPIVISRVVTNPINGLKYMDFLGVIIEPYFQVL